MRPARSCGSSELSLEDLQWFTENRHKAMSPRYLFPGSFLHSLAVAVRWMQLNSLHFPLFFLSRQDAGKSQLAGRCRVGTTFSFVLGVSEWTVSCLPWTASTQSSRGVPLGHLEGGPRHWCSSGHCMDVCDCGHAELVPSWDDKIAEQRLMAGSTTWVLICHLGPMFPVNRIHCSEPLTRLHQCPKSQLVN